MVKTAVRGFERLTQYHTLTHALTHACTLSLPCLISITSPSHPIPHSPSPASLVRQRRAAQSRACSPTRPRMAQRRRMGCAYEEKGS